MLSDATSGFNCSAGCSRSSIVMVAAPPVVKLSTTLERRLLSGANSRKYLVSLVGGPSPGSRACRCTIAAPASAAATAASAISCGVTGKCGDIDGVWIEPVIAQVMMTLRVWAMVVLPLAPEQLSQGLAHRIGSLCRGRRLAVRRGFGGRCAQRHRTRAGPTAPCRAEQRHAKLRQTAGAETRADARD